MFRTVFFTGPAFHTVIPDQDSGFFTGNLKHIMRANPDTHPAAIAENRIKLKGNHIFQIN